MFYGGVAQLYGNIGDAVGGVFQEDQGFGHFGFEFFLKEGCSIVLLQEAFGLPLAEPQPGGEGFQSQILIFIKETFFNDQVIAVCGRGLYRWGFGDRCCVFGMIQIPHGEYQKLCQKRFQCCPVADAAGFQFVKYSLHQRAQVLSVPGDKLAGGKETVEKFRIACLDQRTVSCLEF